MSELAACVGTPVEYAFRNITYKIAPRDFEIEAIYTRWLESRALAAIQRHGNELSPIDHEALLSKWNRDCACGVYDLDSVDGWRSTFTAAGRKQMALLQLQKGTGPRATMDIVEQIFDDPAALREFESAQRLADQNPRKPWARKASSLTEEERQAACGPVM